VGFSYQTFFALSISTKMRRAVHLLGKAFRETGQAMDRLGLTVADNEIFRETYARHRNVLNLYDKVIKFF
jgi:dipeptidase